MMDCSSDTLIWSQYSKQSLCASRSCPWVVVDFLVELRTILLRMRLAVIALSFFAKILTLTVNPLTMLCYLPHGVLSKYT